jgi:actin related protein 2/3 complex subunit 3
MRAYRSQQTSRIKNSSDLPLVCGVPLLPLSTGSDSDGPSQIISTPDFKDIISEAIEMFRFNILLKNRFDIHSPPDKVLVYIMVWIRDVLQTIAGLESSGIPSSMALESRLVDAVKLQPFPIPGDENFALNQFFALPTNDKERALCQKYLSQLRIETARRIARTCWDSEAMGISKWWIQYRSINFMGF